MKEDMIEVTLTMKEWKWLERNVDAMLREMRTRVRTGTISSCHLGLCGIGARVSTEGYKTAHDILIKIAKPYLHKRHISTSYWWFNQQAYNTAMPAAKWFAPRIEFLEFVLRLCKSKQVTYYD